MKNKKTKQDMSQMNSFRSKANDGPAADLLAQSKMDVGMSAEQHEILDIFNDADNIYLSIISQLKIDHADEIYVGLIRGMLERQTRDHLIMTIWKNMDDGQASHFRDYINQMSVIAPWASNDDLLIEFAMLYPDLMEKVHEGLSDFFKGFVERFNEISEG